ncbi:[acyl-carrier-protein] S-malonyltransferase [Ectothiorhodospiraceae bacterium BW-2]|nr:[acyl-carrier-protein] S-malonyltransferase [Ectothiorhodospiraceae bacterium BW-2]
MSVAVLFPGQGSQSVGMLTELAAHYPQLKETVAEASAALGEDLWQLMSQGPEAQLNRTDLTQPVMLTAGVAVWRLWQQQGVTPAYLAGHSLGEYTALVAAGSLGLAEAVVLVAERGKLMQQAVPDGVGAMAAIMGLDSEPVVKLCAEISTPESLVSAVNFNSPQQIVIAGHRDAVEAASVAAKAAGAKRAKRLPVSVPSHCALMAPAAEQLAQKLAKTTITAPEIAVINNVDVACEFEPEAIKLALVRQLYSPVRWVEIVSMLADKGVTTALELGSGKVLAGLNKRITTVVSTVSVFDSETLHQALKLH